MAMNTCKECEWYEKSDISPYRMKCAIEKTCVKGGYSTNIMICKDGFTPKNPEEKKAHKTVASVYTYKPGKATWANKKACDKWKKTKPKEVAMKNSCLNCRRQRPSGDSHFYCKRLGHRYSNETDIVCDYYKKTKSPKSKSKENKMNRLKKWIRRYVMGCTLYCTAVICIALNPWVCKLWEIIGIAINGDEHFWDDCPSVSGFSWFFTALSFFAIYLSYVAFEKATAFIFGELEK